MSLSHDELWTAIGDRCATLEPGTELVTPLSDRAQVRFDDSGETRTLWRDQFEVLADRPEEHQLDVVLAVTDLDEDAVYDIEEQVYVQKTGVEEEKYARLQGLADRIDELDGEAGEALREDLLALEERLDEALSA